MKLEREHLFRTCLRLFRRKNDLSGLQKQTKQKTYHETQCEVGRANNLFILGIYHVQVQNAYLWIISALETSNLSHVTFFILTNALDLAPRFEQISISSTVTAMMILCILITTLTKGSRGGDMTKRANKWPVIDHFRYIKIQHGNEA